MEFRKVVMEVIEMVSENTIVYILGVMVIIAAVLYLAGFVVNLIPRNSV